jgi:hypothetical protein
MTVSSVQILIGPLTNPLPTEHVAYFFLSKRPPTVCKPDTPLTFGKISVWRLHNNQTFDLINWTSNQGEYYELDVENGNLSSSDNSDQIY